VEEPVARDRAHRLKAALRDRTIRWLGVERAFTFEHRLRKLVAHATWFARPMRPPIFIWGAGRTGSYLLYDLLSLHPEVICVRAPDRESKGLYGDQHHGRGDYLDLVSNPYPPIEAARTHVLGKARDLDAPFDRGRAGRSFRMSAAATLGSRRLMDKAPHYTFLVPFLDDLFPGAQHIHCVRNPYFVAASYIRRMKEPGALDAHGFWGFRPLGWEAFAGRSMEDRAVWSAVQTIRLGMANAERLGPRCLTVRYEDLTSAPHAELARAWTFLDLEAPELASMPTSFPNFNSTPEPGACAPDVRADLEALALELDYRV
jgi:hypothetical protein